MKGELVVDAKELEIQLAQRLMNGELKTEDVKEKARKRLPNKTEIRIQAQIDPVVEETKQYRDMAEEVDNRYERYDRFVGEKDKSDAT